MKKLITVIGVAALLATVNAQETGGGLWDTLGTFFKNNPTNSWDVSSYGLWKESAATLSLNKASSFGAGARVGYWITPAVGAALDLSYCDRSWTFASLGLAGRATITLGSVGTLSPYASVGPGWNIQGEQKSIVAVAAGGATLHINKLPWFDLFGEYQHITTTETQNRIAFGLTKRF